MKVGILDTVREVGHRSLRVCNASVFSPGQEVHVCAQLGKQSRGSFRVMARPGDRPYSGDVIYSTGPIPAGTCVGDLLLVEEDK